MNVLIILGHPDKKSFNHAIAQTCIYNLEANGHSIVFHDLYAEKFNPLLVVNSENKECVIDESVKIHCEDLKNSDAIIIIHPDWWGQPPAIIKGWLDRIFLPEVAYEFDIEKHMPIGLLKAQYAIVFNTSNNKTKIETDPLEIIWKDRVFNMCGIDKVERRNFCNVKESNKNTRLNWLSEVDFLINYLFPKI